MKNPTLPAGMYSALPFDTYQQAPGLNQSALKHFYRPTNYHNPMGALIGNAGHCLLLEPERFETDYVRVPEGVSLRSKSGEQRWQEIQTEQASQTLLAANVWDGLMRAKTAVQTHPQAGPMLKASDTEVSLFWHEPQTSLLCKGRLDLLSLEQGFIADVKFSQRSRSEANTEWHYAFQAAWYRQGLHALTGDWLRFFLIFVERYQPHRVSVIELEPETLEVGDQLLRQALEEYQAAAAVPEFD
jgi:exodeoxyribonuclease VIII